MIKRLLLMIGVLLLFAFIVGAQNTEPETTPEITAEVTSEVTPEATDVPEATPEAEATEDPECPALVSTALELTQNRCEGTDINQACYGFVMIESETRPGGDTLERPGDRAAISDIQSLQLSGLDTSTGQWGVLEFKVEALVNDPSTANTATPQDVQFVVFGDTQLSDAGAFVRITPDEDTPVYHLPDGSEVIDELEAGVTTVASVRLAGDEWLRIPVDLEDGTVTVGWVQVEAFTIDDDISVLPEWTFDEAATPPDLTSTFGPMQAFVFESGVDDAPCSAAPNSGMLIQTPEGVASVTIVLDEVVIQLNGTGFVQAQTDGEIRFDILDGEAQVTSEGETRTAVEGQSVSVDLDENGQPLGAPNEPEPLDLDNIANVPVDQLDDDVEIAPPLILPDGVPISGQWALVFNVQSRTCDDGSTWPFVATGTVSIQAQQDGLLYENILHGAVGAGSYQGSYTSSIGDTYTNLLLVTASDQISGTITIDFAERECTLTAPFTMQLVSQN